MKGALKEDSVNGAGGVARRRLLDAAAACCAERGYTGTSVRGITALAQCNVGAVNYYFDGKLNIYIEVFEQRLAELTERRVGALQEPLNGEDLTLESVVETFSWAFLVPLRGTDRGRQTMLLLMREMVDGHLPAGLIAERMFKPTLGALFESIDRACPALDREGIALCCLSLISQLVHVIQVQRLHERGHAGDLPRMGLEKTVQHIVQFTAAGIRTYLAEDRA